MKMSFTSPSSPSPRTASPSSMLFLSLFFFFFVSLHKVAFGVLEITTPQGLIDFSNNVNSGTSYSRTSVYLATDLDLDSSLSQQFQPIGINATYSFKGTFDGQGHVIKNLNLSSSSEYVGLFGYSNGASIRNVTIDGSCSISSFSSNSNSDVGSVVGYCSSTSIENVVNMASVTFVESKSVSALRVGGIVGRLASSSTIRNCVNYGSVTYSGTNTIRNNIGGITGLCGGSSTNTIQNCANYGTLTHNGTSSYLYVGGITGYVMQGTVIIENCVSAGKIVNTTQISEINYIGGVVGFIYSGTITITHCLWTGDVGCSDTYARKETSATVTVTYSNLASLDTTTMGGLNEYAEGNSWDKWFMLHLNGGTINNLTQDTLIVTQEHFPVPVKEGYTFSFWCMDADCADVYDPETTDITSITDLYAGYIPNNYTATFNFGNGTTKTKKVFYGEKYGTLPAGERAGWTFIGWFTGVDGSGDEITNESTVSIADDHALYAHWTINNYTLTFIFDNGESDVVRTLNYSEPIDYPGDPVREGYSFNGWSENIATMPAHNLNITAQWTINNYTLRFILNNGESDIVEILNYSDPIYYPNDPVREGYSFDGWSSKPDKMPAHNLNITAQWTKIYTNVTEYVEIVFDKKDLSENDVKTIIRKYAGDDDNFVIANIETVNGETKVIIKFTDAGKAQNFVEIITAASDAKNNRITKVYFIQNEDGSYSVPLFPNLFNWLFI